MFIDTHCHLNFPQYDADRAMVVGNAKKAGVKQFINPGVDLYSSKQAVGLALKYPGVVFAAIGFHPYEAQHYPEVRELERILTGSRPVMKQDKTPSVVVAVGECGLDYHQYKGHPAVGKKDNQKRLFETQLRLALEHDLPVILHCRDAFDDFFDVLDSVAKPTQGVYPEALRGVIHCFSGGLAHLRMAKERHLFVGIDGNVTYSKHLTMIAPQIPLDMLLLETDAPYLAPNPHRGSRNEPKYIPLIAKKIAQLQHTPVKEVEETTTRNACSLFQIS